MFENLGTEKINQKTKNIDTMTSLEFVQTMNEEDHNVTLAVKKELHKIAEAIDAMYDKYKAGGRIIYIGAGTSGRLGILDAVECVPTFGLEVGEFIGLIAGGEKAVFEAVEGAEDSFELGISDLENINFSEKDVLIGIAASGRTPYVISALKHAKKLGGVTIGISNNKNSEIGEIADISIEIDCGPEVLTGSTRLKAGTAQKLVLNMLSTGMMVQCGKTFGNLMVDVKPSNQKLIERSKRIIMEATDCDYKTAEIYLEKSNRVPKIAITMLLGNNDYDEAKKKLEAADGFITRVLS